VSEFGFFPIFWGLSFYATPGLDSRLWKLPTAFPAAAPSPWESLGCLNMSLEFDDGHLRRGQEKLLPVFQPNPPTNPPTHAIKFLPSFSVFLKY